MQYRLGTILILVMVSLASPSPAEEEYTVHVDPVTKERYFIFTSSKGNIRFNHGRHQIIMKAESCLPCHKTPTPTKEHTMSRINQQTAHAFCRGCHRDKGRGPVECHECHKENNK